MPSGLSYLGVEGCEKTRNREFDCLILEVERDFKRGLSSFILYQVRSSHIHSESIMGTSLRVLIVGTYVRKGQAME
jgi:hypothetical protein